MFNSINKYLTYNPVKAGVNLNAIIPDVYKKHIEKVAKFNGLFEKSSTLNAEYSKMLEEFMKENKLHNSKINLNYYKLIALKTADLVCGYTPSVVSSSNQEVVADILNRIDFKNEIYNTVLNTIKQGGCVKYLYVDEESKLSNSINLEYDVLFPILTDDMTYKVKSYLILNVITIDKENNKQMLIEQEHFKGYYILRKYEMSNMIVGRLIHEETIKTGLSDFAIVVYNNYKNKASDLFGASDLEIIESVVSEITARLTQISINNNKFANPTAIVEEAALTQNDDGSYSFKTGGAVIETAEGKGTTRFLESGSTYDSCFKELDFLIKQLAVLSELGLSVMGLDESGQAQSGLAMEYKLMSPLSKAKRLTRLLNNSLAKEIRLLAELDGHKIDDIQITWYDALPADEMADAEYVANRINNRTMSIVDGIKYLDENITDEEAETKAEEIRTENATTVDFTNIFK